MKQTTVWVTFGDPLSPLQTIRLRTEDPKEPNTYVVQVEHRDGESWTYITTRAILLAKQKRELSAASPQPPKRQTRRPAPPPSPPEQPPFSFEADEIEPFIDEVLTRMLCVAEHGIRLELVGTGTASTDCRFVVYFNPEPFLRGQVEAGFGRGIHEAGHIRFDNTGTKRDRAGRYREVAAGAELLTRAHADGGEMLAHILNLIMDRRSDDRQANEFPGNASALYHRLGYLMPGPRSRLGGVSPECCASVLVDFAYAIKKRTRPRHAIVRKCVQIALRAIKRVNDDKRRYEHLLTASKIILDLLRKHFTSAEEEQSRFDEFMKALNRAIFGKKADPELARKFRVMMAQKLVLRRRRTLAQLPAQVRAVSGRSSGGRSSGGKGAGAGSADTQTTVKVPPNPNAYKAVLAKVSQQARFLRNALRMLSVPETHKLTGLTRGEFDIDALPILATGRSECMKIDFSELQLDLAIAFLLDASGSMSELHAATELAVAFNEATIPSTRSVDSRFFAFNDKVFDCGPAKPNNGIAGIECTGGTMEHWGVCAAGDWLASVRRRRKVLMTFCDGAPWNPKLVRNDVNALLLRGILPIRILVGVDVAPRTYPVELFFDSWEELNRELVPVFSTVIRAVRSA